MVHHDLAVALDPATHRLKVRDRIRIPGALVTAPLTIALNADLAVQASGGLKLLPLSSRAPDAAPAGGPDKQGSASTVPVNGYGIEGATPGQDLAGELDYEGVINYTTRQPGSEYARAFAESPGVIEPRGTYLAGSTHWVPRVGDALVTYALTAETPVGWKSVSQGERVFGRCRFRPGRRDQRGCV